MSTLTRDETITALAGFGVIAAHAERICDVAAQYGQNSIPVSDGIVDVFAVPAGHPRRPGFRVEHANSVAAGTAKNRFPVSTPAGRRSPRPEVASPNARGSRPVTAADQLLRAAMRPAPAPAAPAALHAECSACGFEFSKPQRKGTCNVKAACDKRAAGRQGS